MVNNGDSSAQQWTNVNTSMSVLDDNNVPYGTAIGNHDYDNQLGTDRTATYWNTYFNSSRYEDKPSYGGSKDNNGENTYFFFNESGIEFMVLFLEFCPRNATIDWANDLISNNSDKQVLITIHSYMDYDDTRVGDEDAYNCKTSYVGVAGDSNHGEDVWEKLGSLHDNIFFITSGHVVVGGDGVGYRNDTGASGNIVHQILSDYQTLTNGGNGWLRIYKFSPDDDLIYTKTYSPYLDAFDTLFDQEFSMSYNMDITYPTIDYGHGTATNNSDVSRNWIYVNVSVTEINEDTITFNLYNTSLVNSTSFTDSTRIINWTNLVEGVYHYNVTINDTSNNENSTDTRIITLDNTAPTPTFSCSPTSVRTGQTITCSCTATDNVDSSPSVLYTANPLTSSTGTFTTTCTATDDAGNSATSSISYIVSSSSSGGGGSPPTHKPTQKQMQESYEKTLRKNHKIKFDFKNETHLIKMNKIIDDKTIEITISSEPITFNLSLSEIKKVNLDNDSYYDLKIFLKDIRGVYADLVVKLISEEIPETASEEEKIIKEIPKEKEKNIFLIGFYFLMGFGILIIIFVLYLIIKKKKLVLNFSIKLKDIRERRRKKKLEKRLIKN